MQKLWLILLACMLTVSTLQAATRDANLNQTYTEEQRIASAYKNRRSDIQVQAEGKVVKVLPDDKKGLKHQKFILKLNNGVSILIAHNIDLAPRIADLQAGDTVAFYGEYEYSPKGGTVHWTHKDPRGKHIGGWLKHNGKTYE